MRNAAPLRTCTAAPRLSRVAWALIAAAALLPLGGAACEVKVPIVDVGAEFTIADVTWFEDEQTLFVLYRVDSLQGLSDQSQIELSYRTDDVDQTFVDIAQLVPVHTHVAASCGEHTLCGSTSIWVERPPRDVHLRLRYHKDSVLTLDAGVEFHVVNTGPAHTSRSAVVYGVFDEQNAHVQWRLRHQFPGLRNEQVQDLGLRRDLSVASPGYGALPFNRTVELLTNPYGYGLLARCGGTFTPLDWERVGTLERAVFDDHALPLAASPSPHVCAMATVQDATGAFTATALAQKNPEVEPAFAALHSPVTLNRQLRFMLQTCDTIPSLPHRQMQLQRLLLDESDVVCIDDFGATGFSDQLARRLQDRVDAERTAGEDMVLVIGLQRPNSSAAVAEAVERALALVVAEEDTKSAPRLSGAFVFDSVAHAIADPTVARTVLWCPASGGGGDLDAISDVALRDCALQVDQPDLQLGPVRLNSLPILPTRPQYERYLSKYGEGQAGQALRWAFRAPARTPLSVDVPLGDFGSATFFNNEAVTAAPSDAFSFCADAAAATVVFRLEGIPDVPGAIPLSALPDVHAALPQDRYPIGLAWDFPFNAHLDYLAFLAGAATVVGFTVPFGLGAPAEQYLGSAAWLVSEVDLRDVLLQCTRFCAHPTFDSASVYNVLQAFNPTYLNQCYAPRFPRVTDGGFPRDP